MLAKNDDGDGEEEEPSTKDWCWVIPDPATELNDWSPAVGGANWGFCLDTNNVPKVMINYEVIVHSSNIG